MKKHPIDRPLALGLLAGLAFTTYIIVSSISMGVLPLAIILAAGAVMFGGGIGLYLAWLFGTKVIKKR